MRFLTVLFYVAELGCLTYDHNMYTLVMNNAYYAVVLFIDCAWLLELSAAVKVVTK